MKTLLENWNKFITEQQSSLKKVNWDNLSSLNDKEKELLNNWNKFIMPIYNKYMEGSKEYRKAVLSMDKQKIKSAKDLWDEAGKAFDKGLLQVHDYLSKEGYEPPDYVVNAHKNFKEKEANKEANVQRLNQPKSKLSESPPSNWNDKEMGISWEEYKKAKDTGTTLVAIRDEQGNLKRVPEKQALEYYQNMAKTKKQ